ncbi:MAG: hypothetical protein HDT39_02525 [Lachnospiraceae bacterium]|nr:hypothetical protein [Lachnospiraceae bacterium]
MKGLLKQSFSKFMKESAYRAEMTLYFNFAINVIYAVFKTVCGFVYHSVWMGTLAFYYILLSFMRLLLVKGTKHVDTHKRWKKYCQCGWLLLLFTIALVGMSILIRKGEGSIHYPGYLIYGVATYTFYSMVIAIRNVHKYRKMNDPIYLANKVLNLAVAVISIFSLQAAMLSTFGDDPDFNRVMGITTGFGAFVIINFMTVVMIVKGYKEIRLNTAATTEWEEK